MKNYTFTKLYKNIFIVNFNTSSFIVKIPFSKDYDGKYSKEFDNNMLVTSSTSTYPNLFEKIIYFKQYLYINIYDDLDIDFEYKDIKYEFTINIDELTDDFILLYEDIKVLLNKQNCVKINDLTILIEEYNEYNITVGHTLNNTSIIRLKLNLINNCMDKIRLLHDEVKIIHGDMKINNILNNSLTNNITFIDLEFTIFIDNKKILYVKDIDLINNYLNLDLDDDFKLTVDFMKLFDIYIFTISYFITNTLYDIRIFIESMEYTIYSNLENNKTYSNYFILFFITYKLLYEYFINIRNYTYTDRKIDNEDFYACCEFNKIFNIYQLYKKNSIYFKNYKLLNDSFDYINNIYIELYNINFN